MSSKNRKILVKYPNKHKNDLCFSLFFDFELFLIEICTFIDSDYRINFDFSFLNRCERM